MLIAMLLSVRWCAELRLQGKFPNAVAIYDEDQCRLKLDSETVLQFLKDKDPGQKMVVAAFAKCRSLNGNRTGCAAHKDICVDSVDSVLEDWWGRAASIYKPNKDSVQCGLGPGVQTVVYNRCPQYEADFYLSKPVRYQNTTRGFRNETVLSDGSVRHADGSVTVWYNVLQDEGEWSSLFRKEPTTTTTVTTVTVTTTTTKKADATTKADTTPTKNVKLEIIIQETCAELGDSGLESMGYDLLFAVEQRWKIEGAWDLPFPEPADFKAQLELEIKKFRVALKGMTCASIGQRSRRAGSVIKATVEFDASLDTATIEAVTVSLKGASIRFNLENGKGSSGKIAEATTDIIQPTTMAGSSAGATTTLAGSSAGATTTLAGSSDASNGSDDDGLGAGAIAGIIVAVLVCCVLMVLAVLTRRNDDDENGSSEPVF